MVAEFIRLGNPQDLIVQPGQPHEFSGASADYMLGAVRRCFVEHLEP